ncbi:hypothetical protein IJJ39_01545 [Candidatus Saccharibacteria bacterium]|nr:hypothetical protein [Candidatus Saccharibacteria bacterium]
MIGGIIIKVITDGIVYIQDFDLKFIMDNLSWMPNGILDECFEASPDGIVTYAEEPSKSWRFVHKFENKRSVRWFRDQRWLVDWNEASRLAPEKLRHIIQNKELAFHRTFEKFKSMPQEYKDENHLEFFRRHEKDSHELTSLILVHQYLTGDVWFYLPPGARPATNMTLWAKFRQFWLSKSFQTT